MKLWYYSNLIGQHGWFKDPAAFRAVHGEHKLIVRCAHNGITPPKGWHKPNGELADGHIEKQLTMRDLIHALTP